MLALQKRDPLVAMLDAQPVNNATIGGLRAGPCRSERRACEIGHGHCAKGAWNGAFRADWRRLSGKRLFVGRHELRRPWQARQRHFLEAGAAEVPASLAVAVEVAVTVLRRPPH